ncbi:SWIM zinc finger family protein [Palaeococcus pacificus]|uniref:SWIM zinc finger family protein n=1 Tax=Palaeococcus pacificus TaxID=971279 RepID=UPI00191C6230|nr:hypothetical protein [Palaeococcus pacificus]
MKKAKVRGEKYYKEGRVLWVLKYKNILFSKVLGTYPYYVRIDLEQREGRCTCPLGEDCKHVHATLKALRRWFLHRDFKPFGGTQPTGCCRRVLP